MSVEEDMRRRLEQALAPELLELHDDSSKHEGHAGWREGGNPPWRVTIVSAAFAGKMTVARHRMVYAALGELMQHPIHALQISARAPGESGG